MHLLSTLRPTQTQLQVLAKIIASQNVPARAAAEISANTNLIAARNILMKLNLIIYTDNEALLTDKGEQLAKEQNIIDDSGQLTDEGNKLASTDSKGNQQQGNNTEQPPMNDLGAAPGMGDLGLTPGMEGFSQLFKNIING